MPAAIKKLSTFIYLINLSQWQPINTTVPIIISAHFSYFLTRHFSPSAICWILRIVTRYRCHRSRFRLLINRAQPLIIACFRRDSLDTISKHCLRSIVTRNSANRTKDQGRDPYRVISRRETRFLATKPPFHPWNSRTLSQT